MTRALLISVLISTSACVRARRVLAPDRYVTPAGRTGEQALVIVETGWDDEAPEPYDPTAAFEHEGVLWVEPVPVTDRGWIEVVAVEPDAEMRVFTRETGWEWSPFRPVIAVSGTLGDHLPTAVRFLPVHLGTDQGFRLYMADLQNVYAGKPIEDGDLLLIEVGSPGSEAERYVFRARRYGWRTRAGAGVLVRLPLPIEDQQDVGLSPALTLSLTIGYRFRTRKPLLEFPSERLALVVSAGVGSTALDQGGPLEQQLQIAFDALLVGGGVELFEFLSVQVLGNATAAFRDNLEAGWTLAVGLDAVQAGRAVGGALGRLVKEHPLQADRPQQTGNPMSP